MIYPELITGCMKLGAWGAKMSPKELEFFIDGSLDLELNLFDHADIYGGHTTEKEFGNVVRKRPDLKSKVKIITKCGIAHPSDQRPEFQIKHYNTTAEYIRKSIDQSLKNLGIDHIELFLIHRPDLLLNPQEVADAIGSEIASGKIKHFGASNFTPSQFELLNAFIPLETNQVQASIVHLDPFHDGTIDQLLRLEKHPTVWSPMGGGDFFLSESKQTMRIKNTAQELATTHNCSWDHIILAWLMQHPSGIVPVVGTTKLARLKSLKNATQISLSREEWYRLYCASTGVDVA
jgi:predicted oxidoreductase